VVPAWGKETAGKVAISKIAEPWLLLVTIHHDLPAQNSSTNLVTSGNGIRGHALVTPGEVLSWQPLARRSVCSLPDLARIQNAVIKPIYYSIEIHVKEFKQETRAPYIPFGALTGGSASPNATQYTPSFTASEKPNHAIAVRGEPMAGVGERDCAWLAKRSWKQRRWRSR
jgi:hypothetical protein